MITQGLNRFVIFAADPAIFWTIVILLFAAVIVIASYQVIINNKLDEPNTINLGEYAALIENKSKEGCWKALEEYHLLVNNEELTRTKPEVKEQVTVDPPKEVVLNKPTIKKYKFNQQALKSYSLFTIIFAVLLQQESDMIKNMQYIQILLVIVAIALLGTIGLIALQIYLSRRKAPSKRADVGEGDIVGILVKRPNQARLEPIIFEVRDQRNKPVVINKTKGTEEVKPHILS